MLGLSLRQRLLLGGYSGGVIAPFDPLSLSPALWLDASDTATVLHTANAVYEWRDKSGNSRHALQGTSGNRPVTNTRPQNSLNAIDFNGTSHSMLLPSYFDNLSTKDFTVYVVFKPDTSTGNDVLFSQQTTASRCNSLSYTSTATQAVCGNFSAISNQVTMAMPTTPAVFMFKKNATTGRAFYNGLFGEVKTPVAGWTATFGTHIGAFNNGVFSDWCDGLMCEFFIFESDLSETQINNLNSYAMSKWGFTNVQTLAFDSAALPSFLTGRSTIVAFGDSFVTGFSTPTVATVDRWTSLIAAKMGATLTNSGVNSTPMQNTTSFANNGRDRYVAALTGGAKKDVCVIMYGANDFGNTAQASWTRALFKSDYQEVITGLLGAGYTTDDIILSNMHYIRDYNFDAGFTGADVAKHEDFNLAVRELCVTNGLRYADTYTKTKNAALISRVECDKIHANAAGNRLEAEAILQAQFVT